MFVMTRQNACLREIVIVESFEITISKKRTLEIDVDISVEQRRIQYLYFDLSKVCDPTSHLQLNFPPKFLSHQAFLI